ncbi:hypothetical protein BDW59DRAFT_159122 [Aspergillus cavernicola]|uniref:DUF6546 domain-containing protein n=1 Tax=Aspergillus cavernicola TaxID=176166 RepID=A0ABR4IP45_9EURO
MLIGLGGFRVPLVKSLLLVSRTGHHILSLDLKYDGSGPFYTGGTLPVRSSPGKDQLCLALHSLSQTLVTLKLQSIIIAPELFWPFRSSAQCTPTWPRLTSLIIEYAGYTPSGKYLFEPDPVWYDHGPTWGSPDYVRIKPVHELLNNLYQAAGQAAQHMPKLELMVLESDIWNAFDTLDEQGLPKSPGHLFIYHRQKAYTLWASSSEFWVDPDVQGIWEGVATKHGIPQCRITNKQHLNVSVVPSYLEGGHL